MTEKLRDITDELSDLASLMELEVRTRISESSLVRARRIGDWFRKFHPRLDLAIKSAIVCLKETNTILSPEEWHRPSKKKRDWMERALHPAEDVEEPADGD